MRVIAGKAKGRKLRPVPGDVARPITDRVKESLFNILGGGVVDALFLDLFAGTGSVGIEALSRGARRAVFVERNRRAIETIKENLKTTGLAAQAEVVRADVFRFLAREPAQQFDLIYIAPPQYKGLWAETLLALDRRGFLTEGGLAIAQIYPKEYREMELKSLELVDQRKYGSTMLCFYRFLAGGGMRNEREANQEMVS
ncbi:MAG: 16S rRNA (guanine(966)-N(2))-methyltransferase RsmD [Anaerolineae bacterium]|nr:16S rRNA (guanine(966)-N(2))-methyltransferase RsmD [Anaerolineae bacterium]